MKNKSAKITEIVKIIYLIIICSALPLYMKQGYYMLGEAKGVLYLGVSAFFFALLFILKILEEPKKLFCDPQKAMIIGAFVFSNAITLFFSCDKRTAFLGQEGWRCGFLSVFLMISFCVLFMQGVKLNALALSLILIIPFSTFVLGILNRFGIYPFYVYGANPSFLGTLGNINWYVGFLGIFVPLGIGLSYGKKFFSLKGSLTNLYVVTGLVALFLQGSDSAALVVIGTYGIMLYMSFGKRKSFQRFLAQAALLGFSMELTKILMELFGRSYNYEEGIILMVCDMHIGLIVMAAAFFVYRVSRLFEEINVSFIGKFYRRALVVLGIAAAVSSIIMVIMADGHFGNGRGIIWQISVDIFKGLSSWQKLFGVGQDCFYVYAYNHSGWAESLLNVLNGNRLTNAHGELLTILIERGMIGALTYGVLIISVIHGLIKTFDSSDSSKKEHAAMICALPITSYLFNCSVSFSTVTSTPYLFILLGIALFVSRAQERE